MSVKKSKVFMVASDADDEDQEYDHMLREEEELTTHLGHIRLDALRAWYSLTDHDEQRSEDFLILQRIIAYRCEFVRSLELLRGLRYRLGIAERQDPEFPQFFQRLPLPVQYRDVGYMAGGERTEGPHLPPRRGKGGAVAAHGRASAGPVVPEGQ